MNIPEMERRLEVWAAERAGSLGLDAAKLKAEYMLNPGGFSNLSFAVGDGRTRLHAKLADREHAPRLERWRRVHAYLEEHYFAPKLIGAIDEEIIPGRVAGLVFAHFDGVALESAAEHEVPLERALAAACRLHRDGRLRDLLMDPHAAASSATCADVFADLYISRFREDLEGILAGRHLLPFVADDTLAWFATEIDRLEATVREDLRFALPAESAVHRDLHWNNVLVGANDAICLIDWDDLSPAGDPALDLSILLWPLRRKGEEGERIGGLRSAGVDEAALERLDLYFRAALFDEAIDSLADYVEAEPFPEIRERSRLRTRAAHQRALADYRGRYG